MESVTFVSDNIAKEKIALGFPLESRIHFKSRLRAESGISLKISDNLIHAKLQVYVSLSFVRIVKDFNDSWKKNILDI